MYIYIYIYIYVYLHIYNIHTHKRDAPQNQWYIMVFHCTFPISLAGVSPFRVGAHEVLVKPRQGALFQVVQWWDMIPSGYVKLAIENGHV